MHISDLTTKWPHSHQCSYNCQSQVWWLHLLLQGTFCHLFSIILFYLIKVLENEKKTKEFGILEDDKMILRNSSYLHNFQVIINKFLSTRKWIGWSWLLLLIGASYVFLFPHISIQNLSKIMAAGIKYISRTKT